jgi:phage minor structural protein, N-terminal domain protein|nr:MAG TPA: Neck appendage protein [Caudoviricetes sp.]
MIYLTEGNTPLNEAYNDEIVQERNNTYQLTFRFPTSDPKWELLKEETFLTADDLHGEQDFYIFEVERQQGYIQVYANQVISLLNNYIVSSIDVDRVSGTRVLSALAGSITRTNPFSFFSDIDDRHTLNIKDKNAMEVLAKDKHSILGQWGGDMVRNGYNLRLLKNGGSENESLFMYKKNLSSYQHKTSTKSLKTRITFKTTVKGEGEKAPDVDYVVVIDSPLLGKYTQIYEAVVEVNDQNVKDQASLIEYGKQYFRTSMCDMLEDNLEISVVGQSDAAVRMFDVVSIYHEWYGLDVRKKITKYTYSPMAKRLKSIGFGTFQSSLANAIGGIVNDAVLNESRNLHKIFEERLKKEIANADRAFDAEFAKREKAITDAIEQYKAKAEEVKQDISSEIDKRFQNFDNASIQEAKRKAEEALKKAGASSSLANEAKTIADQSSTEMNQFKQESSKAQRDLSENVNRFKSELQQSLAGKADNATVEQTERALRQKFESLSTDTLGKINAAKTEFEKTAQGLSTKITKVETYVDNDGQRQDDLKRYAREESASQARAVREDVTRDFVGKSTFQESVQGVERRLESLSLGTSGNLLKNSNDGFYNQHDKRYRLVETLQANQTYTLVTKYWHGENAAGHTFLDGIGNWRRLTYNKAIDAWMVQFTPTQEIPAGTEITLSSDPYESKGNMHWATLVRGAIPLVHWLPAKGDVEEGVRQKLAEFKETVDGRFATISSQINGKANQSDFQRVKETSQLYERIIGSSENDISNKVARMALTNQLFQVEVAKSLGSDNNLIVRSKSMDRHTLVNDGNTKRVFVSNGIFTIRCTGNSGYTFAGFTLPLYIDRMARGETYTLNFKYRIMERLDHKFGVAVKNHQANDAVFVSDVATSSTSASSVWRVFNETYTISRDFEFEDNRLYPFYFYLAKNGWVEIKEIMLVRASQTNGYKASQFDDMSEAVRSVQSQLAGSWSVQNINSAGDLISGINLGANGHNRFVGKLTHITGETLIDKAVIKSAMVDKLKTANFEAGSVTTTILDAEAVTADKVRFDDAFIRKMIANEAFIDQLTSKRIFATKVESVVSSSTFLEAYQGRIGGFTLGQFDQGGGRWISGVNQFSVGMGNGAGYGVRTAFWANWGNNWNYAGPKAWNVNTDGKMYCRNEVGFYDQVDFSNASRANFYGTTTFSRSPIFSNGIELGDKDVFGDGWNPKGGRNAVVWWNQVGSGSVKYWMEQKSDRRLKENITDTAVKALDKINRLRMVAFDFIESKKHEEIGLIAQEAETIVPRIVSRDPENPDGYLHIDYTAFVPYLIKAIQELNQKINLMEEKYGSII